MPWGDRWTHPVEWLRRSPHRHRMIALVVLVVLVAPLAWIAWSEGHTEFSDQAPDAGAAAVSDDPFGDNYTTVRFLDQGWSRPESLWFYTTTQGSDLLSYDIALSLPAPTGEGLLLTPGNVLRWRYLPQRASRSNPDALPVGFVRDRYAGHDYLGFSCSACHTGELTYQHTALRIDGGPAVADMEGFLKDLQATLDTLSQASTAAGCSNEACRQFVARVLARGHYKDAPSVLADLAFSRQRVAAYNRINQSGIHYGYARLDAFGRIFNRVFDHLLRPSDLDHLLPTVFAGTELTEVRTTLAGLLTDPPPRSLLGTASDRLGLSHRDRSPPVIEQALNRLSDTQAQRLRDAVFSPPSAPVSYPYLWDVPYTDYVQWNALAGNGALGPVGRNAGEVIGVFGTLDWAPRQGFSLSSLVGGQPLGEAHISFESSVNVHNLTRIENQLHKLKSPQWPEDLLPKLDQARLPRGRQLFVQFCQHCHEDVVRDDPDRRLIANVTRLERIGTDPTMATNSVTRMGASGMLRNQYARTFTQGDVLLGQRAPAAALLTTATLSVVATPYPHRNPIDSAYHWIYDLGYGYLTNKLQASLKTGDYQPDTSAEPYASLKSYKGRALNGIWATAPYLHNGSVPSLYDLLLPAGRCGAGAGTSADARPELASGAAAPAAGTAQGKPAAAGAQPIEETRPTTFLIGSREFDPVRVGLRSQGYAGFVFDTRLPGNHNNGHDYGNACDPELKRAGRPPLSREERLDLLEYLKSL